MTLNRPVTQDSPTPRLIPRPTATRALWLSHINALVSSCCSWDEQTSIEFKLQRHWQYKTQQSLKHLRSALRLKSCISGRTTSCPGLVSPVFQENTPPFWEGLVVLLLGFTRKLCLFLFVMSKLERNQHQGGKKIGHWVKEHEHKWRRFKKDNSISLSFMFETHPEYMSKWLYLTPVTLTHFLGVWINEAWTYSFKPVKGANRK